MRCVRADQSSITLTLHALANGNAVRVRLYLPSSLLFVRSCVYIQGRGVPNRQTDRQTDRPSTRASSPNSPPPTLHTQNQTPQQVAKITILKQEFLIPAVLLLKALREMTDEELFARLTLGDEVIVLCVCMCRFSQGWVRCGVGGRGKGSGGVCCVGVFGCMYARVHSTCRGIADCAGMAACVCVIPSTPFLQSTYTQANTYLVTRVEMLLREAKPFAGMDRRKALAYLGA